MPSWLAGGQQRVIDAAFEFGAVEAHSVDDSCLMRGGAQILSQGQLAACGLDFPVGVQVAAGNPQVRQCCGVGEVKYHRAVDFDVNVHAWRGG